MFTNFLHTVYTNTQNMKHISNLVSIFFCWLILSFIRACLDDIKTHKTIYTAHTFSYDCLLCSVHCFAHCSFGLLFSFMFFFLLNIDNLFVLFVHVGVLCVCSKVKEPHDFSICFLPRSVCQCACACVTLICLNEQANDLLERKPFISTWLCVCQSGNQGKKFEIRTHSFFFVNWSKKSGLIDELMTIIVIRNDAGNPSFRMKMHRTPTPTNMNVHIV